MLSVDNGGFGCFFGDLLSRCVLGFLFWDLLVVSKRLLFIILPMFYMLDDI